MKDFTESDNFKMTYQEDVTWLDLCQKLDQNERQERIPANVKMEFLDIGTATKAKKALASAIGYIRAGKMGFFKASSKLHGSDTLSYIGSGAVSDILSHTGSDTVSGSLYE